MLENLLITMGQDFWRKRINEGAVLSPIDRISEVLFGLIMVLTFTGAISVASERSDVRELLWAALGCNVAWGIVDAVMYLMNVMLERGHGVKTIRRIQGSKDPSKARAALRDEISPLLSSLLTDAEADQLNDRLKQLPVPTTKQLWTGRDLLAGLEIFLLVFICTLPVALPFAWVQELSTAMRISNGIALVMLFGGGFILARYAGFSRWPTALAYAVIGVLMVGLTMALGG